MVKLGIFYEQDKSGKDTGRVQVADKGEDGFVYDVFDTEEEAVKAMAKMQADFDREDKIKKEYLAWETECRSRHNISRVDIREFLVSVVLN